MKKIFVVFATLACLTIGANFLFPNPGFVTPTPGSTLVGLDVHGPSTVNENSTTCYSAYAFFSEDPSGYVDATWSENSPYAYMSGNCLVVGEVPSDQTVRVTATYTYDGVTKTGYRDVLIKNYALDHITITGPSNVAEGGRYSYSARAYYTDGSSQDVTGSSTFQTTIYFVILRGNSLLVGIIPSQRTGTVTAYYSEGGVSKSDSMNVTVWCQ